MAGFKRCGRCGRLAFDGDLMTIPASNYEALLKKAAAYDRSTTRVSAYRLKSKSPIARNPELADFILKCSETMVAREILARCQEKFEQASTPSISSIYRFIQAVDIDR